MESSVPIELWTEQIMPFVGDKQFRYVAAVNHQFYTAFTNRFPNKETICGVDTLEQVQMYFHEVKKIPSHIFLS
jgi:hypothetical protein